MDVLINDLVKGSHFGQRKIDINVLFNLHGYNREMTTDEAIIFWSNPANRVNYNRAVATFTDGHKIEINLTGAVATNLEIYNQLYNHTTFRSYLKNTSMLMVEHPITSTVIRFIDTSDSPSNLVNIVLHAVNANGVRTQFPLYTWFDTTSSLDVVASNIHNIMEIVGKYEDLLQRSSELSEEMARHIQEMKDIAFDINRVKAEAEELLKRAEGKMDELKNLSIAVHTKDDPDHVGSANYNPATGMLTITVARGRQGIQGERGFDGQKGLDGFDGQDGKDGDNAYMVAVIEGFNGNVIEWLESLQGKDAYQIALDNGFVGTVWEWLASLHGKDGVNGKDGKSTYQLAVENGFVGTVIDWLLANKGKDGKDGINGRDGRDSTVPGPRGMAGYIMAGDYPLVFGTTRIASTGELYLDYSGSLATDVIEIDDQGNLVIHTDADPPSITGGTGSPALPLGGDEGEVLMKFSNVDGDADWKMILPKGGTKGQIPAKKTDNDFDIEWIDAQPNFSGTAFIIENGQLYIVSDNFQSNFVVENGILYWVTGV